MKIALFIYIILFFSNYSFAKSATCAGGEKYENTLKNISTMQASFVQNINGKYDSSGIFLLKRPGKMLVDYNKGNVDAVIGINGKIVTYLNRESEQISHIPRDKTPAHFILDHQKFADLNIIKCEISNGEFSVEIHQEIQNGGTGVFKLFFNETSADIVKISTINENKDEIALVFANSVINGEISDKKFVIQDPRL